MKSHLSERKAGRNQQLMAEIILCSFTYPKRFGNLLLSYSKESPSPIKANSKIKKLKYLFLNLPFWGNLSPGIKFSHIADNNPYLYSLGTYQQCVIAGLYGLTRAGIKFAQILLAVC